ncbi:MAG: acylphosphatase [Bacteroidetes bacterium]|nr:MAG: acylphosphatase [Bacteroidota bacterium]
MIVHKEAVIRGKVQGVFFRGSTREKAEKLGLVGEVKNLPDGSVWLAVEGEEELVEELIAWCHQGPLRAEVDEVVVNDGNVTGYTNFQVTRY